MSIDNVLAIDIMNYPWEVDRTLWAEPFKSEEYQIMARTTFKSMFKGQIPDRKMLQESSVFPGHLSVTELLNDMTTLGYQHVVITAMKMWSPYWHRDFIVRPFPNRGEPVRD